MHICNSYEMFHLLDINNWHHSFLPLFIYNYILINMFKFTINISSLGYWGQLMEFQRDKVSLDGISTLLSFLQQPFRKKVIIFCVSLSSL